MEQVQSSTPYYYHADQLGSIRALSTPSGTLAATYSYDPYGNPLSSSGTLYNPFRYAGEYRDSESGFYYLRARYYDPATAQFLTPDPLLKAAGMPRPYAYAEGSPLNATDPSGMSWYLTAPQSAAIQQFLGSAADAAVEAAKQTFVGGLAGTSALGYWVHASRKAMDNPYLIPEVSPFFARLVNVVSIATESAGAVWTIGGSIGWLGLASTLNQFKDLLKNNTDPCLGVAIGEDTEPYSWIGSYGITFMNRATGAAQKWYPPVLFTRGIPFVQTLPTSLRFGTVSTFGGASLTHSSAGYVFIQDIPAIP